MVSAITINFVPGYAGFEVDDGRCLRTVMEGDTVVLAHPVFPERSLVMEIRPSQCWMIKPCPTTWRGWRREFWVWLCEQYRTRNVKLK